MNFICWLVDHVWRRATFERIYCTRCRAEPYDDVTLPEWFRNMRIEQRLRRLAKRVRLYAKSRKCWKPGHDWSPTSCYCQRCGMSGVEDAERGEWMLPEWKKLWRGWLSDRIKVVTQKEVRNWDTGTMTVQRAYFIELFLRWRIGFERSPITFNGSPYMTRYICYLGPINLRLHQFFRGDDDTASHTHPWWFITMPFSPYQEAVHIEGKFQLLRTVKAFRFHFRPSGFEHFVTGGVEWSDWSKGWLHHTRPFWTLVITGGSAHEWGFYTPAGKYIPWQKFKPGKRT